MAVGAVERREERRPRVEEEFGSDAEGALDLLEVMELAWHDLYSEVTFPDAVFEDLIVVSEGRLDGLIRSVRLGLTDWRDLRVAADAIRHPD